MGKKEKFKTINILGYNIFSENIEKCVKTIFSYDKVHVVSGNPEVLYTGLNNKELYDNFTAKSSLIIPDGVFLTNSVFRIWKRYRSTYPKQIKQVAFYFLSLLIFLLDFLNQKNHYDIQQY